jgi:hypothetical protein
MGPSDGGNGPEIGPEGGGTGGVPIFDASSRDIWACASEVREGQALADDLFVMLDKSGSMNCAAADSACENPTMPYVHPTRWDAFVQAVNSFVNSPGSAGIGVGLGYFSLAGSDACNVASYARPTVPIAPLPGNATSIQNAVAGLMPGSNTPTVPALQGALQYAQIYVQSTPGRKASVVFVTDGLPNGCGSTIPGAVMAAQQAFLSTPSIKTYVVGLGNTAALDQVALAGSGGAQHYFPAQGDVAGQLSAALTSISGRTSCDYAIAMNGDPHDVNVQVMIGGGMPTVIGYVGGASMCGSSGGWYYDNPIQPTRLTLCPQTCDPIRATAGSRVQVLYGCPRIGPGVN